MSHVFLDSFFELSSKSSPHVATDGLAAILLYSAEPPPLVNAPPRDAFVVEVRLVR